MGKYQTHLTPPILTAITLLLMHHSPALQAGEKENRIINKAVAAYGGDRLLQLQRLQLTDTLSRFTQHQSGHSAQGPMTMHLDRQQMEVSVDLANRQKSFRLLTTKTVGNHGSDNQVSRHRLFLDGRGYTVDHCLQHYQESSGISYDNADAGFSQLLDPLIIRQLAAERDNSQLMDTAYIQDQPHDVLTINASDWNEYTLYLNQQNGYLSRMLRKRGGTVRSYDFLDHRQTQGITWASELFVSTAKQPLYHTDSRQLTINPLPGSAFTLPGDYQQRQRPEAVDVSQLTIRQLAKDVYFVGQGWGYTLFIDLGNHYISAGAWHMENNGQAWQQALALLKQTTGQDKPVAQHLVSHHHTDHMAGLADIVAQGAKLIIHPADIPAVNAHLSQPLADSRFVPVTGAGSLAGDKIKLFDVPNSHASHNLVIYLPEHQLLFTEDMFGSSFQDELDSPGSWPNLDAYQRLRILHSQLQQRGLKVTQYVSSHHARVLTQADIDRALTLRCPANDELHQRLFAQKNGPG